MGKRERWPGGFMERSANGRFKNHVSYSASYTADRRKKAQNKVKSGYGHRGDHAPSSGLDMPEWERMTRPQKGINILGRLIKKI